MTDSQSPGPLDPRWPRLLVAARVWRANYMTSPSLERTSGEANLLLAIRAFDVDIGSGDDPGGHR